MKTFEKKNSVKKNRYFLLLEKIQILFLDTLILLKADTDTITKNPKIIIIIQDK